MPTHPIPSLTSWLARRGRPPAEEDEAGLCFDTPAGIAVALAPLPPDTARLVASPGYLDAQVLQSLIDDPDGDRAGPADGDLVPALGWRADGLEWTAMVDFADGLLLLVVVGPMPGSHAEWDERIDALERTHARWASVLSPVRVAYDVFPSANPPGSPAWPISISS